MRKIIVMIYIVLDVALLMLLAIIIYKLNLSTKEVESSILNKSVDNNSLTCTVNKKTKSPYSDELLNTCIVYENGNAFLYYGNNEKEIQGKIVFIKDSVKYKMDIYKSFIVLWATGSDFHYHCTTDYELNNLDIGYFRYTMDNGNKYCYQRILRYITKNELLEKKERFFSIIEQDIR